MFGPFSPRLGSMLEAFSGSNRCFELDKRVWGLSECHQMEATLFAAESLPAICFTELQTSTKSQSSVTLWQEPALKTVSRRTGRSWKHFLIYERRPARNFTHRSGRRFRSSGASFFRTVSLRTIPKLLILSDILDHTHVGPYQRIEETGWTTCRVFGFVGSQISYTPSLGGSLIWLFFKCCWFLCKKNRPKGRL